MSRLNPEKLFVEFREGVTAIEPIVPRRYTLTHSDKTAELFLTIGSDFAYDKVNKMRDEILAEWVKKRDLYYFYVYLKVDGDKGTTSLRNYYFRCELPLGLEAIRYGDKAFFLTNSLFNRVPIIVFFHSKDKKYNKVENWGSFSNYDYMDI